MEEYIKNLEISRNKFYEYLESKYSVKDHGILNHLANEEELEMLLKFENLIIAEKKYNQISFVFEEA